MRKIKKYDIEKFLYSIAKSGIKLKTQKNVIGVLHAFFTHLFDLEILSEMPKFPTLKFKTGVEVDRPGKANSNPATYSRTT